MIDVLRYNRSRKKGSSLANCTAFDHLGSIRIVSRKLYRFRSSWIDHLGSVNAYLGSIIMDRSSWIGKRLSWIDHLGSVNALSWIDHLGSVNAHLGSVNAYLGSIILDWIERPGSIIDHCVRPYRSGSTIIITVMVVGVDLLRMRKLIPCARARYERTIVTFELSRINGSFFASR